MSRPTEEPGVRKAAAGKARAAAPSKVSGIPRASVSIRIASQSTESKEEKIMPKQPAIKTVSFQELFAEPPSGANAEAKRSNQETKRTLSSKRQRSFDDAVAALEAAARAGNEGVAAIAFEAARRFSLKITNQLHESITTADYAVNRLARKLAEAKSWRALRTLLRASKWTEYSAAAYELAWDFARCDHAGGLEVMVELGFQMSDGWNPLIYTAIDSFALSAVKFLIPHTDFDRRWRDGGYLPIGCAAHEGNLAALRLLLRSPAAHAKGAAFAALESCVGHDPDLDKAMTRALLRVVDVNAAPRPYKKPWCALLEFSQWCDCEHLAARIAKKSTWGFEKAMKKAIENDNPRFAAGIAAAMGAKAISADLLAGDPASALAFVASRLKQQKIAKRAA